MRWTNRRGGSETFLKAGQREPALPVDVLSMHPTFCRGRLLSHAGRAMKPKSMRSIAFPEDGRTSPAWLGLMVTLILRYAAIVVFELARSICSQRTSLAVPD